MRGQVTIHHSRLDSKWLDVELMLFFWYKLPPKQGLRLMIRCVISDLGKVILHFDNTVFYEKIAKCSPFSKDEIKELIRAHFDLIKSFDRGEMPPQDFYARVKETLQANIDYDDFYSIYNNVFFSNPKVLDIMKRLKQNYRLLLLSNTDIMRFGFIRKRFPEILIFDDYILSYEVGSIKPEEQIYKEALRRAEFPAQQCLFIDDMQENVEAARKLGIQVIQMKSQTDLGTALADKGISF